MNKILKNKGCRPQNVLFRIANENKKGGFHLRETTKKISKSRGIAFLGKGSEGTVYIGCPDPECKTQVAIKQGPTEILKKEYMILKKINPIDQNHIVKPFAFYECGNRRGVLYMEYIDGKSLFHQVASLTTDQYRTIIKQIVHTLYTILEKYPKFRHYDLHLENIFVDQQTKRAVIADFGFASLGDDNKELVEYGIGPGSDYRYDVHLFLNSLYGLPKLPREVRSFIEDLIPADYLGNKDTDKIKNNRLRLNVGHCALPSIRDILAHPFFSTVVSKTKQRMVHWANSKNNNELPAIPREWLMNNIKAFNKRSMKRVTTKKQSSPRKKLRSPPKLKLMTFAAGGGMSRPTKALGAAGGQARLVRKAIKQKKEAAPGNCAACTDTAATKTVAAVTRNFKNIFGLTMNEFHAIERKVNLNAAGNRLRGNVARIANARPAAKKMNGSPPKAAMASPPKKPAATKKPRCPNGFRRNPKTGECDPTPVKGVRNPPKAAAASPPRRVAVQGAKSKAENQAVRYLQAAQLARNAAQGVAQKRPTIKKKKNKNKK